MAGNDRQRTSKMLSLDGLEMIAVLVVMGLFIKVLEQFGMFEPVGGEGNGFSLRLVGLANRFFFCFFFYRASVKNSQLKSGAGV